MSRVVTLTALGIISCYFGHGKGHAQITVGTMSDLLTRSSDIEEEDSGYEDDREPILDQKKLAEEDETNSYEYSEPGVIRFSSREIRSNLNYGLGLGIGATVPWQTISIDGQYQKEADLAFTWSTGRGNWTFFGEDQGKPYEINAVATSSVVGVRYYFAAVAPLYVQPAAGYVIWKGDVEPAGIKLEDKENARLRSSFDAAGAVLGATVGFAIVWENGFFLDYTLIGIAKTLVSTSSFTEESGDSKAATVAELANIATWGFLNMKFGYFF